MSIPEGVLTEGCRSLVVTSRSAGEGSHGRTAEDAIVLTHTPDRFQFLNQEARALPCLKLCEWRAPTPLPVESANQAEWFPAGPSRVPMCLRGRRSVISEFDYLRNFLAMSGKHLE